jgi:hypothetical protein
LLTSLADPATCVRRGQAARAVLHEGHSWQRLAPRVVAVADAALAAR